MEKAINIRTKSIDSRIRILSSRLSSVSVGRRAELLSKIRQLEEAKKIIPYPTKEKGILLEMEKELNSLINNYNLTQALKFLEKLTNFRAKSYDNIKILNSLLIKAKKHL